MKTLMCANGVDGLGHVSRALKISRVLGGAVDGASVLIVTNSSAPHSLAFPSGVDCIKIPSLTKESKDLLGSRFLPLPFEEVRYLRERILLETARAYEPDLVIVDRRPVGMKGELLPPVPGVHGGGGSRGIDGRLQYAGGEPSTPEARGHHPAR